MLHSGNRGVRLDGSSSPRPLSDPDERGKEQRAASIVPTVESGSCYLPEFAPWVGDVVEALIELIQNPKAWGEVFNIGQYKEISMLELANLVKQMTESKSEIVFVSYDQAYEAGFEDMHRRLPDLARIEELIGYKPTLDLREMLERIIAYYKEKRGE